MSNESLLTFFQSSGLVSLAVAQQIAEQFHYTEIARHELFLAEGKISDAYLFLEKGFMRAYAIDTGGNEVTTNFCGPGQVVFEVASFFNRTRSKENIQALTACEGWCISYEQLNGLFHALPQFREFGRSVLVKGFSALKSRMLVMITETAEQRYAQLLTQNPEIFRHAPLKTIASYLGITDTSLSRIRKDFARKV